MATTLEELQVLITSETSGLRKELGNVKKELGSAEREVKKATASIGGTLKKLGGIFAAVFAVKKIIDFGRESVAAANSAVISETKLSTIMKQRMKATDGVIQSVKDLAAAQEAIGVVGAPEQIAGAQELATYLQNASSLKSLIPVMNDLVAQQYGLSASAEQVTGMATMLGKVMDGQVGALSRYGFTFDQAQEDILKYGTEAERVSLVVDMVKDSIGNMNEELGKTPQGQMKQLRFTFDGIQDSIGRGLMSAIQTVLPYLQMMANVLLQAAQYFQMLMSAIFGTAQMSAAAAGAALGLAAAETNAGDAAEAAGKKAKGSVAGFDEINQLADQSGNGNSDGGAGALDMPMPDIDTETIPTQVQEMVDKVKGILSTLWDGVVDGAVDLGGKFAEAFSGIGPALQPLIDAREPIVEALGQIGQTVATLADKFLKPVAKYILLDFIPSIVTGFMKAWVPVFADTAIWAVEEFSKTFENVTSTVSSLWNSTWMPSLDKFKGAMLEYMPQAAKALQTLLDGTIKPFVDFFVNSFVIPIAAAINQTLVPILTDVIVWAMGEMGKSFMWGANLINDIYITLIEPVFNLIKDIVLDTLTIVTDLWQKYGETLLTDLSGLMDGLRTLFQQLWDVILKPIIQPFLETLSWLWEKHLKAVVEQVGDFIMKLVTGALEIINVFILPIVNVLIDILGPTFVNIFNFIVDIVSTAISVIADIISGLIKILGGIVDFLVGVFTGNWEKAWEGIKEIFSGIWDIIVGVLKGALNLMIDMINVFVRFWNNIKLEVPSVNVPGVGKVGGFSIGVPKIGEIPKLARGGIVDGATNMGNYIAGEAGAEMIVPLENTPFIDKLASALGSAVLSAMQMGNQNNNSGDSGDLVINVDGTTLARVLSPYLTREQQRIGYSAIIQPI